VCKRGAVAHHAMKLESAQESTLRSVTALLDPAADDPVATRSCMAFWLTVHLRLNLRDVAGWH
jgi:hypothetical protein